MKINFLILFLPYFVFAVDADLSTIVDRSGTGSMIEVQKKNVQGHEQYSMAAVQLAKNSMMQFVHGSECASSCPLGCCDSGEGLMFEAGMFSMLNHAANTQASEHRNSAMQACLTFNKLSSSQKNCAAEISPLSQFVPKVSWYDDKGKCLSSAPKECQLMESLSVSPSASISNSCSVAGNVNCTKKFFEDFKLNPDGTLMIKLPTGTKKMSLSDFADSQKLVKLGLDPDKAKGLVQKFSQSSGFLKSQFKGGMPAALSLASDSYKSDRVQSGDVTLSEGATSTQERRLHYNDVTRLPAAADVRRKLGDDPIGRSDEDIFKMIKQRYMVNDQNQLFN